MAKHKLRRFKELETFERTFQFPYPLLHTDHGLCGNWHSGVFQNNHPIIVELGCGRGEYTVSLAQHFKDRNFIGVDIKGARLWRGAKTIHEEKLMHAAFLRTHIEWLPQFFAPKEISEIWITFPDPQPQLSRENRRITNPKFLKMYRELLGAGGVLHLKTDNLGLFEYTMDMLGHEAGVMEICTKDLYANTPENFNLGIQTTYEKIFLKQGFKINYLKFRWS